MYNIYRYFRPINGFPVMIDDQLIIFTALISQIMTTIKHFY
jgi:hypothetical protein